jgi:hypothetical protein
MASLIAYTKKMLVQRLRQDIANDYPDAEFAFSEKETLLHIDQALAFNAVGSIYNGAKVLGSLEVPEGYLTRYALAALVQDSVTSEWYATLPQPPVSLPLGYSITRCYFASTQYGVSQEILPIKAKRVAYRNNMPRPAGAEYKISNGSTIFITANDGSPLSGLQVYVEMLNTRTSSMSDVMALPDDAIEGIYNLAYQKLTQRYKMPKDVIDDGIGGGNTTQKS